MSYFGTCIPCSLTADFPRNLTKAFGGSVTLFNDLHRNFTELTGHLFANSNLTCMFVIEVGFLGCFKENTPIHFGPWMAPSVFLVIVLRDMGRIEGIRWSFLCLLLSY